LELIRWHLARVYNPPKSWRFRRAMDPSKEVPVKSVTILLASAWLALGAMATVAANSNENSVNGTWGLNAAKSKFSGPGFKSQTRTYAVAADGTTTMSFTGTTNTGATVSGGSSFKYDGKDYPITGSGDFDTISGKKINDATINFWLKKSGKLVGEGSRMLSEHGKVMTLTSKVKGADGKPYTSMMVFDRQ
jgi:hypothetical protein